MSARELYLEAEVAHLKDRIAELTGKSRVSALRRELGLAGQQAALLALLMARTGIVSHDAIYTTVFEHPTGDGPDAGIINAVMCRLRARLRSLRAAGRIENVYGAGYSMTPDLRTWLNDRIGGAA